MSEECEHGRAIIQGYICKDCSIEVALAIKDGFLKAMDKHDVSTLGDTVTNLAKKMGIKI